MSSRKTLRACDQGVAAIEFAFAGPILIMLMIGMLQAAVALHAAGGVRHAIGEGARFAKVHRTASVDEVRAVVRSNFEGLHADRVKSLVVERGLTPAGAPFARIAMVYEPEIVIPFLKPRTLRFQESRLVYLPA